MCWFLCCTQLRDHVYVYVYVCEAKECRILCYKQSIHKRIKFMHVHRNVECISHRDDWSPSHSNLLLASLSPIRVFLFPLTSTDLHLCQSIHPLFPSNSLFALSTPLPLTLFSPPLRTIVILPRVAANPLD